MSKVSYLDQLKEQHQMFCAQRDQTQANFQQLVGAIYACEVMMAKCESQLAAEVSDVKTDEQTTEQAPQE